MTDEPTHVYLARWPTCECVAAACVDEPDHPRDTASAVAAYIRRGRRVERVPLEALRVTGWSHCAEHPKGTPRPWERKRDTSGPAALALMAILDEPDTPVHTVAPTREQAAAVFRAAKRMVRRKPTP